MKKLILAIVILMSALPSFAQAHQRSKYNRCFERTNGSYCEEHMDYKMQRANDLQKDKRSGYYNGEYHNQSATFRPNDEQFVAPGRRAHMKHHH